MLMFYPGNYGFIPQTEEEDGDPTDVLVLGGDPLVPISIIRTHPIGVLLTEDEKGQDSKIIAVPIAKIDQNFATFIDVENIPEQMRNQIKYFFEHYKELEQGKYVKVVGMVPYLLHMDKEWLIVEQIPAALQLFPCHLLIFLSSPFSA
jgi:inorganic pyrophosphatase